MKEFNSDKDIMEILKNEKSIVLYIGSSKCSVCKDMLPKIEKLEKDYSKIKFYKIEYDKELELMGRLSIYTVPAIIGYMEGKEYLREARFISLGDIRRKIDRYYNFIGEDY